MSKTIDDARRFCTLRNWRYKDAGDFIIIGFDILNQLQPIYVKEKYCENLHKPVMEISYFGGDISDNEIQNTFINSVLLKRNEKLILGKWVIKTIVYDDVYEFRYITPSDQVSLDYFVKVIGLCINEINYFVTLSGNM